LLAVCIIEMIEFLYIKEKIIIFAKDLREKWKGFRKNAFFRRCNLQNNMDFKAEVTRLINEFLETRPDLFLIDLKISPSSDITVILDGDNGVSLQDCLDASRAVEFNLDREVHDFGLQVMSAGLSEPLESPRQFRKNIGRAIDVLLSDDSRVEGELVNVDEEKIVIRLEYRRPKLIGKGKEDVVEDKEIPYSEIKKALVVIKF
jgi:ribosome maturation factor RimP